MRKKFRRGGRSPSSTRSKPYMASDTDTAKVLRRREPRGPQGQATLPSGCAGSRLGRHHHHPEPSGSGRCVIVGRARAERAAPGAGQCAHRQPDHPGGGDRQRSSTSAATVGEADAGDRTPMLRQRDPADPVQPAQTQRARLFDAHGKTLGRLVRGRRPRRLEGAAARSQAGRQGRAAAPDPRRPGPARRRPARRWPTRSPRP